MAKITVRLPDDIHEALKRCAQEGHRSLNSEIVEMLRSSALRTDRENTARRLQKTFDLLRVITKDPTILDLIKDGEIMDEKKIDELAEHAIREHRSGKTRSLRTTFKRGVDKTFAFVAWNEETLRRNRERLISGLSEKIKEYEARYGIQSQCLEGELQSGSIEENNDVCDWLICYKSYKRLTEESGGSSEEDGINGNPSL